MPVHKSDFYYIFLLIRRLFSWYQQLKIDNSRNILCNCSEKAWLQFIINQQNKWLQRGINIPLKSERLAQYFKTFRKEFLEITHAAGYEHPCQFKMTDVDLNVDDSYLSKEVDKTFGYTKTHVPFESMHTLQNCTYLGGKPLWKKINDRSYLFILKKPLMFDKLNWNYEFRKNYWFIPIRSPCFNHWFDCILFF